MDELFNSPFDWNDQFEYEPFSITIIVSNHWSVSNIKCQPLFNVYFHQISSNDHHRWSNIKHYWPLLLIINHPFDGRWLQWTCWQRWMPTRLRTGSRGGPWFVRVDPTGAPPMIIPGPVSERLKLRQNLIQGIKGLTHLTTPLRFSPRFRDLKDWKVKKIDARFRHSPNPSDSDDHPILRCDPHGVTRCPRYPSCINWNHLQAAMAMATSRSGRWNSSYGGTGNGDALSWLLFTLWMATCLMVEWIGNAGGEPWLRMMWLRTVREHTRLGNAGELTSTTGRFKRTAGWEISELAVAGRSVELAVRSRAQQVLWCKFATVVFFGIASSVGKFSLLIN